MEVTCSNPAQSRSNDTKTGTAIKKKKKEKTKQPTEQVKNLIYHAAVVHGFRPWLKQLTAPLVLPISLWLSSITPLSSHNSG